MTNTNEDFDVVGIRVDAFLADSAEVSNGKISALGLGWSVLNTPTLPMIHPSLSLAMLIHVPYSDTDIEHHMKIQLIDQDGHPQPMMTFISEDGSIATATDIDAQFSVQRNPMMIVGDDITIPMTLPVQNLRFDIAGTYSWVISVNNVPVNRLPLRVSLITAYN